MVGWVFNGSWTNECGFWTECVERERVELEVKCFTEFLSVRHFTSFRFKFYS